MPLTEKQRGVLRGIVIGAIVTIIVVIGTTLLGPYLLSQDTSISGRIGFALKADLIIAIILAVSIGRLARHRFFNPDDIDGGGLTQGTETANMLQATLQNTLEQTVLAVLVHITWAVTMPVGYVSTILAAVILFCVGRVLFVRGYSGGAPSRAIGFALTFYPSILMLAIIVLWVIKSNLFSV